MRTTGSSIMDTAVPQTPDNAPAAIRYAQFQTADPVAAQRFFDDAYESGWHLDWLADGSTLTHRRFDAGPVTVDEMLLDGRFGCEIQSPGPVVVIQPRAGSLVMAGEPMPIADTPLLATSELPCLLQATAAHFHVVRVESSLLRKIAVDRQVPLPQQLQFTSAHPSSRAVVRVWQLALDYVLASFGSAEVVHLPMIVNAGSQLLAAALLETFPSNVNAAEGLVDNPAAPPAFKNAVAFIQRHAGDGIGINDVAAAVSLTPRAVQYLFRQHLETTPTQYLRSVRLHRAHLDLMVGDRSNTTVAAIAQRWGFTHTGRFALLYREIYGQSPHSALRG